MARKGSKGEAINTPADVPVETTELLDYFPIRKNANAFEKKRQRVKGGGKKGRKKLKETLLNPIVYSKIVTSSDVEPEEIMST